ncbi:MAG: DUF3108 domain-containing protein [Opitutaceae bacterium]
MKKAFLLLILLSTINLCFSQAKPGEKFVYSASYNMSGLMTQIAQVSMQTELVKTSKKNFLHISWEAATFSKWDTFFKIRDLYETYLDQTTLKPGLFKRSTFEGGYSITQKYIYNPDGKSISSNSKIQNRAESKKNFAVASSSQDIIALVYKLRTIDFSKYKPGQSIILSLIFDEKEYPVSIKFMGKETITAGNLGKKDCNILSIGAKTDKLKGKDKNLIWLTSDNNRIPVIVRFSIPVGIGQMVLSNASGI